ncbi:MAG: thioredoxin fold domain-containing protein, partial [Pseudomonadota bacterium]|nr:thioredoxin fold domain-containing protein [Pseudomonadota bacterium]
MTARSTMSRLGAATLTLVLLTALSGYASADDPPRGQLTGGVKYEIPDWFKESFLDLAEDVDEATSENRHVLLYFHLDECPYCDKMLRDGFIDSGYTDFIRQNFDSIAINIKGDRVVAYDAETELSERALTKHLKVRYTPTIIFLDSTLKPVLRLNGYRTPRLLKQALDFVQQGAYAETDFATYAERQDQPAVYTLRDHPMFRQVDDFSRLSGPTMLIFEDSSCEFCDTFHDKLLSAPSSLAEMEKFTVVRLDARSDRPVIDFAGQTTTPRDWARQIGLTYRPGIALYDNGEEITRIDGMLYGYHFTTVLRYVGDKLYKAYPTHNDYSRVRRKGLLEAGKTIDYSSY